MVESLSPKIYEKTAKTYDQHRNADVVLVDGIVRHLQTSKDGKYLDIGCGSGNYTVALNHRGVNMEGVDLSHSMLEQARVKAPHQRWTQGDMHSLPFDAGMFDGAITINTLHYVRNSLGSVLQEIRRILKPGARLVIFTVAVEQCLQFWLGHYFPFFRELGHKVLFSKDAIIAALTEADFYDFLVEPFFVTENTTDLYVYACKYRPHLFLDPKIREGMTPLQLPEYAEQVQAGCEWLQKDISSGAIYRVMREHESQVGEGLFVSARTGS
jgi:ubiquinone/menaquinone biosynthesis C-methylase UbiE